MNRPVHIVGRLALSPERCTCCNGEPGARVEVAAALGLVSVTACGAMAARLASLTKGDTVAIAGHAAEIVRTTADGQERTDLQLGADVRLDVYTMQQRRSAGQLPPWEQPLDDLPAGSVESALRQVVGAGRPQ